MITDQSLKKFLSRDYEDLNKGDYEFLVDHYFKTHSKEWFIENEDEPVLNPDAVENIFWNLIRRHAMPHGIKEKFFDFSGFIFPSFSGLHLLHKKIRILNIDYNFWSKGEKMEFLYDVNFLSTKFLGKADFKGVRFKVSKEVKFIDTQFSSEAFFIQTNFSKENRTIFHYCFKKEQLVKGSDRIYSPTTYQIEFNFSGVEFNGMMNFRGIHFHKTDFLRANISKDIRFEECKWRGSRRLVLWKENTIFKILNRSKESFENYLERYRQIKLNYASFQEWELSGKAYRSEMYIRQWLSFFEIFNYKKPLMIPIRIIEFLMSSFYGIFSGYTQSITKPFIWLILSTVLIFPFFYNECKLIELFSCNYSDVLEMSAKNTFPFYRLGDNNFWIALIQKIFSSTLLAFFILALRKKYKQ